MLKNTSMHRTQGFLCSRQILEGVCSILNCRICLAIDRRIPGGKAFSAQVQCLFVRMTLICCMMRLRMLRAVGHPDVLRWTVRLSSLILQFLSVCPQCLRGCSGRSPVPGCALPASVRWEGRSPRPRRRSPPCRRRCGAGAAASSASWDTETVWTGDTWITSSAHR